MTTRIFFDSEFTDLHQQTTLISIALLVDGTQPQSWGKKDKFFYAEFSDYNQTQITPFVKDHVLPNTRWLHKKQKSNFTKSEGQGCLAYGDTPYIVDQLSSWLQQFDDVEIWADCPIYDWMLFAQLFSGALHIPSNIYPFPFDLVTFLKTKGIDPDSDRPDIVEASQLSKLDSVKHMLKQKKEHNALWDANISRACFYAVNSAL